MTPGCPFAYFWQVRPSHFVYNFSILAAAGRPQKKGIAKKRQENGVKWPRQKERVANTLSTRRRLRILLGLPQIIFINSSFVGKNVPLCCYLWDPPNVCGGIK